MGENGKKNREDPLRLAGVVLLERYRIDALFARGGMSLVYRGIDLRLHRPVCIKVFHRLDPRDAVLHTSYEHFVQEAFALSQLSHPHTLRIYDFGYLEKEPQLPFQVSELLDGGTLSQRVRKKGPMSPREALTVFEPLCAALAEAHARGIVHRDLKPGNILFGNVGSERIVKLCDFGIAKSLDEETERPLPFRANTRAGGEARLSLFTPGWAAPEQLRAEPVGAAADVFALGLLLAWVLSGETMYQQTRDHNAFEERMQGDAHIDKRVTEMALPEPLAEVVRRACRDTPSERFATPGDFVRALAGAVASCASPDTPATPREAPPILVIDPTTGDDVLAAGRRVRMLPVGETVDAGGDAGPLRSAARFRLTLLPDPRQGARVHVKGLNCFVARAGARPSAAVSIDADAELELVAPDRTRLEVLRFTFGVAGAAEQLFDMGAVTLAVPGRIPQPVMIDVGPGRELALVHRATPVATGQGGPR
jgi:serine/threonine-protein kinase